MEEKKINEVESLELISKMIQQSKERLNIGSGNAFLVWGYTCVIIPLIVYILQAFMGVDNKASIAYAAIPVMGVLLDRLVSKKSKAGLVKNYTTRMISATWTIVSISFALAAAVCAYFICVHKMGDFTLCFFLGFILPGFGTAFTGIALKEKSITIGGLVGIVFGLAAIEATLVGLRLSCEWHLAFAVCYALMMVIPGHYLNHKAQLQNKN